MIHGCCSSKWQLSPTPQPLPFGVEELPPDEMHLRFLRSDLPDSIAALTYSTTSAGALPISIHRQWNPCNPVNVLEVPVGGNEIGARFHRVGGDPDIIRRNWSSLRPLRYHYSRVAVCGHRSYGNE